MAREHSNVADFLLEGKPDGRIALRLLSGEVSYGELRQAAAAFVRYFGDLGCRKGDRIVLAAENSPFWVGAYLGILKAGLICVPLPPSIAPEDLRDVLTVTESRVAVMQDRVAINHAALLHGVHLITDQSMHDREVAGLWGFLSEATFSQIRSYSTSGKSLGQDVHPDDIAALMFTSGSTGKPRGVMISHRNIAANTKSIIECLGLTESDRIMTVLPFHYCFGASLLHTHLKVGASLVIDARFMYPETVLQRMEEMECTGFAGVPSHFQILLRNSGLGKRAFPRLRYVQQAGGHLAPVFIQELKRRLPGTQIFVMYGQTEATARLSYLPPECLEAKLGSVGKGIPGVSLRVASEAGSDVNPGEIGEIVAEGENIARGYWRDPEETAKTFRNGRLYTGDLATVDQDGFIYVIERVKQILKCGGKRVSCRQVENRILEFECALEAAVVPTPDDVLGEAAKAFLVARMPDCPAFEDCFRAFCKQHMPPQFVPKEFVVLSELPKNASGKVLKQKLGTV